MLVVLWIIYYWGLNKFFKEYRLTKHGISSKNLSSEKKLRKQLLKATHSIVFYLTFSCRNEISELDDEGPASFKNTVSTVFFGENDLGEIPSKFFSSFKRLLWLNLDNNHLRDVPLGSLPPSIVTLSVTNNYITKFPLEVTNNLPSLTWFTLRGNYIETLPG